MREKIKRLILISSVLLPVLMVAACAKPKVELAVSKTKIQQGESVSVNWTSKDAKEVTLNGGKVAKTGTQVFQPTTTTTYELVGRRGSKEARDSEKVLVEVATAAPSITFTAERSAIAKGEKTKLRWSSQNSEKVDIAGLGTFSASGETEVAPFESTTYTAVAKGKGGEASASARVTVTAPLAVTTTPTSTGPTSEERFRTNVRSIFFDFDKSDLRPDAVSTLQNNSRFLLQNENRSIVFRVEGNCDPRGSEEYNLALGDKRANTAKTYLISQGIDPGRMDVISNGKRNAVGISEGSPNSPPSWAHDRRDDFVYVRGGELRPAPAETE
jgi:peptidoglycan-associated lipoprotein